LQIPEVVAWMDQRIRDHSGCRYIVVTDMHSLMQARRDAGFKEVLDRADLVVPDGYPLASMDSRSRIRMALPPVAGASQAAAQFAALVAMEALGFQKFP
jgi:UDP-N-acetyl-D-mannosaminuronic acid transferase (WecB/TagA/CpsF family)